MRLMVLLDTIQLNEIAYTDELGIEPREMIREANYVPPKSDEDHDEVGFQLQYAPDLDPRVRARMEFLKDPDNYRRAMQRGVRRDISPEDARLLDNTGEDYPELDQEKRDRVEQKIAKNAPMGMPIILHHTPSGHRHLLAGNTRLSHQSQIRKKPTPAWHLDYTDVNESDEEDEEVPNNYRSAKLIIAARPQLAVAAQSVYDEWDEENRDEYAGGGICHLIAEKLAGMIIDLGINCTTVSSSHEVHVYVVAQCQEGVYEVDIPSGIYERGGGYSWTKIPHVQFGPDDVLVTALDSDPKRMNLYVEDGWDE